MDVIDGAYTVKILGAEELRQIMPLTSQDIISSIRITDFSRSATGLEEHSTSTFHETPVMTNFSTDKSELQCPAFNFTVSNKVGHVVVVEFINDSHEVMAWTEIIGEKIGHNTLFLRLPPVEPAKALEKPHLRVMGPALQVEIVREEPKVESRKRRSQGGKKTSEVVTEETKHTENIAAHHAVSERSEWSTTVTTTTTEIVTIHSTVSGSSTIEHAATSSAVAGVEPTPPKSDARRRRGNQKKDESAAPSPPAIESSEVVITTSPTPPRESPQNQHRRAVGVSSSTKAQAAAAESAAAPGSTFQGSVVKDDEEDENMRRSPSHNWQKPKAALKQTVYEEEQVSGDPDLRRNPSHRWQQKRGYVVPTSLEEQYVQIAIMIDSIKGIPLNIAATRVRVFVADAIDAVSSEKIGGALNSDELFSNEPTLTSYQDCESFCTNPSFTSSKDAILFSGTTTAAVAVIDCSLKDTKGWFTLGHAVLPIASTQGFGNYCTRIRSGDPTLSVGDNQREAARLRSELPNSSTFGDFIPLAFISWRKNKTTDAPAHLVYQEDRDFPVTAFELRQQELRAFCEADTPIKLEIPSPSEVIALFGAALISDPCESWSFLAPQNELEDTFVNVESLLGAPLVVKGLYKVTAELVTKTPSSKNRFGIFGNHKFDAPLVVPEFVQTPVVFPQTACDPQSFILFRLYSVSTMKSKEIKDVGWSVFRLYNEGQFIRNGRFICPLFDKRPPRRLLEELRAAPDSVDEVIVQNLQAGRIGFATCKILMCFSHGHADRLKEISSRKGLHSTCKSVLIKSIANEKLAELFIAPPGALSKSLSAMFGTADTRQVQQETNARVFEYIAACANDDSPEGVARRKSSVAQPAVDPNAARDDRLLALFAFKPISASKTAQYRHPLKVSNGARYVVKMVVRRRAAWLEMTRRQKAVAKYLEACESTDASLGTLQAWTKRCVRRMEPWRELKRRSRAIKVYLDKMVKREIEDYYEDMVNNVPTLHKLSERYDINLDSLMRANPKFANSFQSIPPGYELIVPPRPAKISASDLARQYNLPIHTFMEANPDIFSEMEMIFTTQRIVLPIALGTYAALEMVEEAPDGGPSLYMLVERYGIPLEALIAANPRITSKNRAIPAGYEVVMPSRTSAMSVAEIARLYGIPIKAFLKVNGIHESAILHATQRVILPHEVLKDESEASLVGEEGGATLTSIAERYGIHLFDLMAANPRLKNNGTKPLPNDYEVLMPPRASSMSASDLAKEYGISIRAFMLANPEILSEREHVQADQRVVIPHADVEETWPEPEAPPQPVVVDITGVYGEPSLEMLSERYRIPVEELARANPRVLRTNAPISSRYEVMMPERHSTMTVTDVAKHYNNIDVEEFMRANPEILSDLELVYPSQRVILPTTQKSMYVAPPSPPAPPPQTHQEMSPERDEDDEGGKGGAAAAEEPFHKICYDPHVGYFFRVEGLRGMGPDMALYKVIADPPYPAESRYTATVDLDSDMSSPKFLDPPMIFQDTSHGPLKTIVFRVFKITKNASLRAGDECEIQQVAWSIARVFLEGGLCRHGRCLGPLFAKDAPPKMLQQLQTEPLRVVIKRWLSPKFEGKIEYYHPKALIEFSQGDPLRVDELYGASDLPAPSVVLIVPKRQKDFPVQASKGMAGFKCGTMCPAHEDPDDFQDAVNAQFENFVRANMLHQQRT